MGKHTLPFWLVIATACAASGTLYGVMFEDGGSAEGVVYGLCIGLLVISYERGLLLAGYSTRLRRLPNVPYLLATEASLLVLVLLGRVAAGAIVWALGLTDSALTEVARPEPRSVIYALAVTAIFVFVLRVRDLIGTEIFMNLMLDRYRRPVSEERVFLFLDLVGSTSYAEKHGDLAAQELLRAVFAAVAEPVRRHRGQVDDYVGDQIILSWPLARGIERGRCVACVFAVRRLLAENGEWWRSRFGIVPELRAALHGGSVITAEVGVDRHKIAYFGDVMNTTARLEGLCRTSGHPVLISEALLERMPPLPDGIEAEAIGEHALRGRSEAMAVFSLVERRHSGSAEETNARSGLAEEAGSVPFRSAARTI